MAEREQRTIGDHCEALVDAARQEDAEKGIMALAGLLSRACKDLNRIADALEDGNAAPASKPLSEMRFG